MYVHPTILILSLPLAIVKNASMNIGIISFWIFILFGYMPRNGIAGSYGLQDAIVF